MNHRISMLITTALCVAGLVGCADPVPDDYVAEVVVEGFVIADQPIVRLRIYQSQPLEVIFDMKKATIRNAQVTLLENGVPIPMQFVADTNGGNYVPLDTLFRAKYESTYELTVRALDRVVTATAHTLKPFAWVKAPNDTLNYPGKENELKPVDSLGISWTGQASVSRYVIAISCLDTLGYGEYLTPPTAEPNERLRADDFEEGTLIANERARYGFTPVSNSPVVWAAFKWFGTQTIAVYAGDEAFQEWFTSVGFGRRNQYDYRLSNVRGGLGVFAGASRIDAPTFLKKKN